MEKEVFAYQWGDKFKRLMDFDKKKIPTFPNLLKIIPHRSGLSQKAGSAGRQRRNLSLDF